jgi:alpha-L-fucosidase
VQQAVDLLTTVPQGEESVEYTDGHWRELIKLYRPSVLWNDIGYPAAADVKELFAEYYNLVPDGVVNDRWWQFRTASSQIFQNRLVRAVMSRLISWRLSRNSSPPTRGHFDFRTAEYTSFRKIMVEKWEATRGIGTSFGYNQNEGPEHCISVEDLVHTFVDIVSKNGNLLLNIGPMADGTIAELQRERLLGLGQWLAVNGEAIFGTRPWVYAGAHTRQGIEVRFTQNGRSLYAILLEQPEGEQVVFESLLVDEGTAIHLLGEEGGLAWQQEGESLRITLPPTLSDSPAYSLRLTPPRFEMKGD